MLELTFHTYDKVTIEYINKICDIPSQQSLQELYDSINNKNVKTICTLVSRFQIDGYYSLDVLLHFIQFIKNIKINKSKLKVKTMEEELYELDHPDEYKDDDDIEEHIMKLINILSNYAYVMSKSSNSYIQLTCALLTCI